MEARYSVELLPSARRELEKLPREARRRLGGAIDRLRFDPRPEGPKLLSGTARAPIWRIRVSDYRVLYQVEDERLFVLVVRIADRREVYDGTAIRRLLGRLRGNP